MKEVTESTMLLLVLGTSPGRLVKLVLLKWPQCSVASHQLQNTIGVHLDTVLSLNLSGPSICFANHFFDRAEAASVVICLNPSTERALSDN